MIPSDQSVIARRGALAYTEGMQRSIYSLVLGWILIVATSPALSAADAPTAPKKIQVEEFDKLRTKPNHVVLDVRSAEEFKSGHVAGAVNMNVHDPEFGKKLQSLDKSKTYLVHCARGKRSALASEQLGKAGLTNILDFTGGFDAWQKAGKPVVKD